MSNRPAGLGRGGRGAALMQLLNQQVRSPGDPQASSAQQSVAAVGAVAPQAVGGPSQPGQVPTGARSAGLQQEASVPPSSAPSGATQPPHPPVTEVPAEPGQSAATMGRGAFLQRLYDSQLALQQQQQQQPASLIATPSEPVPETGESLIHCCDIHMVIRFTGDIAAAGVKPQV